MASLVPCTHCARHVRASDDACPFCGAPASFEIIDRPRPPRRLGRAALAAWGAAFAFTAACGSATPEPAPAYGGPPDREVPPPEPEDEEVVDAEEEEELVEDDAPPPEQDAVAPAYGAPPEEEESGPVAIYGGPPEG